MSFDSLGLSAELLRAVADTGYTAPTPIQAQAIPAVLEGQDIMAGAQTGTGKTAAFTLPMLQRLSEASTANAKPWVRALVLVPTRELAQQVYESVKTYAKHLPIKAVCVYGGVGITPQINKLRAGVEIVVATPGRLLDHVQQKTVDLSKVEMLVLDEADRMLDMGFIRDIEKILRLMPKAKQNMMFSATFPADIKRLANGLLKNPLTIEVAREDAITDLVSHVIHPVDSTQKRALLSHLITTENWYQVLVFVRTKRGADRLTKQLKMDGIEADAIHGDKSQGQRTRALADFKKGKHQVLVATDIAARGLDIEELPQVVNYDLPTIAEDYVHRIGRTGRAGATGKAVSLISTLDHQMLGEIERLLKRPIERELIEGFIPDPAKMPPKPGKAGAVRKKPPRRFGPSRFNTRPRRLGAR